MHAGMRDGSALLSRVGQGRVTKGLAWLGLCSLGRPASSPGRAPLALNQHRLPGTARLPPSAPFPPLLRLPFPRLHVLLSAKNVLHILPFNPWFVYICLIKLYSVQIYWATTECLRKKVIFICQAKVLGTFMPSDLFFFFF